MALPGHLWIEGETQGAIAGSCTQAGREDSILIQALTHEIVIPRDVQSGQPMGKRQHNPFTITTSFDMSMTKLYKALCSGERMKWTCKWFVIAPTGEETHYFTHTMYEVALVSARAWMEDCRREGAVALPHSMTWAGTYEKINWIWEDGGLEAEDDWQVPV